MNEGLKIKYDVYKVEDGSIVKNCFVLRPERDRAALEALKTYADYTSNTVLANDLNKWIDNLEYNFASRNCYIVE